MSWQRPASKYAHAMCSFQELRLHKRTLGFNPENTMEKTCCSSQLFSKYQNQLIAEYYYNNMHITISINYLAFL